MDTTKKSFIVTGANTGLGYACAKHIASASKSHHVVLACRDDKKGKEAVQRMTIESGNPAISFLPLDLASLASVKEFVQLFSQGNYPPLKGLVCNAGISGDDEATYTTDGIETTFQVNCLGHFLLTHLVIEKLDPPARVLMVSSELHRSEGSMKSFLPNYTNARNLAYPDKETANLKGSASVRYSTSKLCMIMYTHEFNEWFNLKEIKGISMNAFNPGLMPDTSLGGLNKKLVRKLFLKYILPLFAKGAVSTPEKSGKILADLVCSQKYEGITNKYFDRDKEINPSIESFDKNKRLDLWKTSVELSKIDR